MVQLKIIPVPSLLKTMPLALSVPKNNLSNGNVSTRLGDRLYSSHDKSALNPKISLILSSGVKLNNGSCLKISKIDPTVEKFGLSVNVYSVPVK